MRKRKNRRKNKRSAISISRPLLVLSYVVFSLILLILSAAYQPVSAFESYSNYDIKNYNIFIKIFPEAGEIEGKTVLDIESRNLKNEDKIELFLHEKLKVKRIYAIPGNNEKEKHELTFDRNGSKIFVYLTYPAKSYGNFSLEIEYGGMLKYSLESGEWAYVGKNSAYAIYESKWYPQIPGDRATGRIEIHVPENWVAISNGEAVNSENPFVFFDGFPEVGFSFAAAEYRYIKNMQNAHMQVACYLLSPINNCEEMLIDILDFMESKLTPYPYPKLVLVEVRDNLRGAHGDQGLIILSDKISQNNALLTQFIAHEIAHNWFGDIVTVKKFREKKELWLLEGFANYMSIEYLESRDREAAGEFLEGLRKEYLNMREHKDVAISDVKGDYGALFHTIAYAKGTWVLRMLNYIMGDEKFHDLLREFIKEHAWGSASIEDFEKKAAEIYGQDLSWFFEPWLHSTLLPDYALTRAEVERKNSTYLLKLRIEQHGDVIKMPLEIFIKTEKGEIRKRIMMETKEKEFDVELSEKPVFVEIDKNEYILEENRKNNRKIIGFDLSYEFLRILFYTLEEDIKEFLMI